MKAFKRTTIILSALALALLPAGVAACNNGDDNGGDGQHVQETAKPAYTKGTWWWTGGDGESDETYLNFAKANGVTEIYYSTGKFDAGVSDFIGKAEERGMSVYYLAGEWEWIYDYPSFDREMAKYAAFQTNYAHTYKGVHLDVEAHQNPEWKNNVAKRGELVGDYIDFVSHVTATYSGVNFDFDIPFWYDNAEYAVTRGGETKGAYKYVIDYASRTFIMSYRDTAEKIYSVGENELEYAHAANKKLFFGFEASYSSEGDQVSFSEEGKKVMNSAMDGLEQKIAQNYGADYKNYGISVHHMKKWYTLKD